MNVTTLIQECIQEVLAEARQICAWCKKDIGEIPGDKDSHGMCSSCAKKLADEEGISLTEGRKVCSICKNVVGDAPEVEGDTHTICPTCKPIFLSWLKKPKP